MDDTGPVVPNHMFSARPRSPLQPGAFHPLASGRLVALHGRSHRAQPTGPCSAAASSTIDVPQSSRCASLKLALSSLSAGSPSLQGARAQCVAFAKSMPFPWADVTVGRSGRGTSEAAYANFLGRRHGAPLAAVGAGALNAEAALVPDFTAHRILPGWRGRQPLWRVDAEAAAAMEASSGLRALLARPRPAIAAVVCTSWADYCTARELPLASIAPLVLHFPLTLYYIISTALRRTRSRCAGRQMRWWPG